jgi:hypothetical protein
MARSQESKSTLAPLPGHVPEHLVYDFDYIYDERLIQEPHERMKSLVAEAPQRRSWRARESDGENEPGGRDGAPGSARRSVHETGLSGSLHWHHRFTVTGGAGVAGGADDR